MLGWFRNRRPAEAEIRPDQSLGLVVGLGNPGPRYAKTRHNVGFRVVERLAERAGFRIERRARRSLVGTWNHPAGPIIVAEPQTFMNNSGDAVAALARYSRLLPSQLLVISDDTSLPLGRIRLRPGGSEAGHNGLRSVSARLGTREYPRLRIGVGRPPEGWQMIDYVLGAFTSAEVEALPEVLERAVDAIEAMAAEGIEKAMSRFNGG